jgi:glycerol-3-phosphate dehydrogenase (NAD(P)+)
MKRLAVIGGGAWGTALALVASRAGADVVLWARDPAIVTAINERHENPVYLPGIALDSAIPATADPEGALNHAEAALLVVPAQFMRRVLGLLEPLLPPGMPLLLCAKGIEIESLRTMSELAQELVTSSPLAVLSGPSFAGEVARDLPTAVTNVPRSWCRRSGPPGFAPIGHMTRWGWRSAARLRMCWQSRAASSRAVGLATTRGPRWLPAVYPR